MVLLQTNYPDECAEVLVLLLNIWCDPAIFDCDLNKLINKLNFLKDATDAIGLEILSSEMISSFAAFYALYIIRSSRRIIENVIYCKISFT